MKRLPAVLWWEGSAGFKIPCNNYHKLTQCARIAGSATKDISSYVFRYDRQIVDYFKITVCVTDALLFPVILRAYTPLGNCSLIDNVVFRVFTA